MNKAKNEKRMHEILDNIENNALDMDDTFQFRCRGCGKCCKNREDILLTARDLFSIAAHLGRAIDYIVSRYCEVYIGGSSRLPIIRLKPSGPEKSCPFLRDKRCIVHNAKPVVCALFPLGRATTMENTDNGVEIPVNIRPRYFIQPAPCGTPDQTHTVRSWLEQFGLPVVDDFYALWTESITTIGEFIHGMEAKKLSNDTMELFWNAALLGLYINYDVSKELVPQFRENTAKLMSVFADIADTAEKVFGGMPDGK